MRIHLHALRSGDSSLINDSALLAGNGGSNGRKPALILTMRNKFQHRSHGSLVIIWRLYILWLPFTTNRVCRKNRKSTYWWKLRDFLKKYYTVRHFIALEKDARLPGILNAVDVYLLLDNVFTSLDCSNKETGTRRDDWIRRLIELDRNLFYLLY